MVLAAIGAAAAFVLILVVQQPWIRAALPNNAILGPVANLLATVAGVGSLVVAITALNESRTSGAATAKILDASRVALERSAESLGSLLGQVDAQRKLLDETLAVQADHLALSKRQYDEAAKLAASHPIIELGIGSIPADKLDQPITLKMATDGWGPIDVIMKNVGDADLVSPTVLIVADRPDIRISRRSGRDGLAGPQLQIAETLNVIQFRLSETLSKFEIEVFVPRTVTEPFHLRVRVLGQGMATVQRSFAFVANHPPLTGQ